MAKVTSKKTTASAAAKETKASGAKKVAKKTSASADSAASAKAKKTASKKKAASSSAKKTAKKVSATKAETKAEPKDKVVAKGKKEQAAKPAKAAKKLAAKKSTSKKKTSAANGTVSKSVTSDNTSTKKVTAKTASVSKKKKSTAAQKPKKVAKTQAKIENSVDVKEVKEKVSKKKAASKASATTIAVGEPTAQTVVPYEREKNSHYMDEEQLAYFSKKLTEWKQQLMEEVDRTVGHMKDDATNFPDPNDRATQEEEFSLELRTRDRERKLIKKINEAQKRIEENEYGYCETCGVEIGVGRLEARPTAELCIDCKTLEEIREKQIA